MSRSLLNIKDTEVVNKALERDSGLVKIDKKKYIRILSINYEARYLHYIGKKPVVCLGDFEKDGKNGNIDKCPGCKKKDVLWDPYNKAKESDKKAKMKEILDQIKKVDLKFQVLISVAVGEMHTSDEEDENGKFSSVIKWDKDPQVLPVSEAQWQKLTLQIFEDYSYMKSTKDLINRSLIFKKQSKEGSKKGEKYTEIIIIPSKKISNVPIKFDEKELPDLTSFFNIVSKKEMIKLLKDQEGDDLDIEDDDLEEDIEIEDKKSKTKKKSDKKNVKKKTKSKKDDEIEEPDFVKEDQEDDDFDFEDDDEKDEVEDLEDPDEGEDDFEDFEDDDED